jgi:hypothetical protein
VSPFWLRSTLTVFIGLRRMAVGIGFGALILLLSRRCFAMWE